MEKVWRRTRRYKTLQTSELRPPYDKIPSAVLGGYGNNVEKWMKVDASWLGAVRVPLLAPPPFFDKYNLVFNICAMC